jgi:hypothetical protein
MYVPVLVCLITGIIDCDHCWDAIACMGCVIHQKEVIKHHSFDLRGYEKIAFDVISLARICISNQFCKRISNHFNTQYNRSPP